jgi:hypothetical protein
MTRQDTVEALKDTALSVPTLTTLEREFKEVHREVQDQAKGLLLSAKRAEVWSVFHAVEHAHPVHIHQAYREAQKTKASPAQTFTQADAEYAQKLHAMATRGAEHEAEVAKGKLESFAKGFGMTSEEVVGKAEEVCPTPEPTTPEQRGHQALIDELERKFAKFNRKQLLEVIADLICKLDDEP